jgi:GGDEF domain-containing protein
MNRKAKALSLNSTAVKCIQALLALLYQSIPEWHSYFTPGLRDFTDPATNFNSSVTPSNIILNGLADMVVRLGGQTAHGQNRWKLCCIMIPDNPLLPLQQRGLIIHAQSEKAPYKLGMVISPDSYTNSPSLRAMQSGHIIYRPKITDVDTSIAFRELEGDVRSAVAVSIGGEYEQPLAVFYVASDEAHAFSEDDQRVLRMLGKIMEELLITYQVRQQVTEGLGAIVAHPGIIDTLFSDFLSESDFINDIEALLTNLQAQKEGSDSNIQQDSAMHPSEEVVSFIAIDVDDQSSLATTYGDRLTRNLSREVGVRLQRQIRTMFTPHEVGQPYHIYADRFCLFLKGTSLEDARIRAEFLRNALKGPYLVDALRVPLGQRTPPGRMLTLPNVTVRLGVASYTYSKLEELLGRYPSTTAVAYVRDLITNFIDEILDMGQREGGNVVMSWDPTIWAATRWSPPK